MRACIAVAVVVGLLTIAAHAQEPSPSSLQGGPTGGKRGPPGPQKPVRSPAELKAEEAAYKAALDRIPMPQQKPDPWQRIREPGNEPVASQK
jgi:hypothetical protein